MIDILFFGRMADIAGTRTVRRNVTGVTTLFALRDEAFADALANGRLQAPDIRMSLNKVVVTTDSLVNDGDEVAFFSVFSGG